MLTSVANDTAWTPYIQDALASYFGPNESDWPEVTNNHLKRGRELGSFSEAKGGYCTPLMKRFVICAFESVFMCACVRASI